MRDKQFSYEEKVDIVREHEEAHKTLKAICEEYDISKSYLCYLLKEYREKGRKAFKDTKSHTAAQKLEIIKRHYEDNNSRIGARNRDPIWNTKAVDDVLSAKRSRRNK